MINFSRYWQLSRSTVNKAKDEKEIAQAAWSRAISEARSIVRENSYVSHAAIQTIDARLASLQE